LRGTNPKGARRCVVAVVAGFGLWAMAATAVAQDQNIKPLLDRIDRLERDVNLLQRQVYRGTSPSGTPMAVSPPDAQGPPDGQSALSDDVRIGQLEDEVRTLTGQIQEVNYSLDQLKRRLDTLSSDVDQRFATLEHGGPSLAGPAIGGPGTPPPPAASATPGVLGTLGTPAAKPGSEQTATAPATLPSGTAQEQYNYAFGLLRQANYPAAEEALKAFVKAYPKDPLAGNAQYWLGETYYVRKDYENAATAFAVGYQRYPKSGKAADNLLKLGMSLGNLGKKGNACSAFARLDRDFPTAPANVKEREASERQQLGC
jgi:tol-pal system protein YbgF